MMGMTGLGKFLFAKSLDGRVFYVDLVINVGSILKGPERAELSHDRGAFSSTTLELLRRDH